MTFAKIISIVIVLLCLSPVVSANWFNATLGEQFEDAEEGMKLLLYAVIGLYIIGCFVLTLFGWKFNNRKVFKEGILGFGVLIVVTILYVFATDFVEYYFCVLSETPKF